MRLGEKIKRKIYGDLLDTPELEAYVFGFVAGTIFGFIFGFMMVLSL